MNMDINDRPVTMCEEVFPAFPPQHQSFQPGIESIMVPIPISENPEYIGSGKLKGKVAIITGGDSGIGKAVAIAFAKEGADVVIGYLEDYEYGDALATQRRIEEIGQHCLLMKGDVGNEDFCTQLVWQTIYTFGNLNIIVNNAAVHYVQKSIEDITSQQLEKTFRTNIFSNFYLVKAALPYLKHGSSIINTCSVTAFEPYDISIDYSSTKGAVLAFTRSLAKSLIDRGIRVNTVAPGMTWTPLIPASISEKDVIFFGRNRPMGRAAQPVEIAPSFVFLASEIDSSYITGQVIVVN
jgi:NAD(P)-dependent dehydrogenase (short-subunit alcohol dehydrogenase family)